MFLAGKQAMFGTKHVIETNIHQLNMPSGRLRFNKVNANPPKISKVSTDEVLDFNVLTPLNTASAQTNVNTNENQSQVSKNTSQSNTETVSTLSQGTSLT